MNIRFLREKNEAIEKEKEIRKKKNDYYCLGDVLTTGLALMKWPIVLTVWPGG
jgi:hypothetical protein